MSTTGSHTGGNFTLSQLDPSKPRRLPIFVASTFRDMDRERDLINTVVIPRVNALLRERGEWQSTVYPVDLRWGVQSDASKSAEDRDREILTTCITEVRRCRPLFLGLVGERYGWVVPNPEERDYGVVRPTGWDQPLSVTAIELLTANEESRKDGVAPIIFTRVPLTAVPEEHASDARDVTLTEHLIRHLRQTNSTIISYDAHWDSQLDCLVSDEFVVKAVDAVLHQVESVLATVEGRHWFDVELEAQRAFSESSRLPIVGRDEELATLAEEIGSLPPSLRYGDNHRNAVGRLNGLRGASTVVVEGEEGSGVTTLLSEFAAQGIDAHPYWPAGLPVGRPPAIVHVGLTELSKRPEVVVLLLMVQLSPERARRLVAGRTPSELRMEDVLPAWLDLLTTFKAGDLATIVVDGVSQLRSPLGLPDLSWLPPMPRGNVKFFLGVENPSFEAQWLRWRPNTRLITLTPLSVDSAKTLVLDRATEAHKALPPDLLDILSRGNRQPGWLALAADLMLTLMGDSYQRLGSRSSGQDAQTALLGLLLSEARSLPQKMEDLRSEQLYRVFQVLPAEKVGAVVGRLAVCPSPLRQEDLLAIPGPGSPSVLELSLIRSALGSALRPGREWQLSDSSTRTALQQILDEGSESAGTDLELGLRLLLVNHLISLPIDDPLREAELLPQLLATGHYRELVQAITDPAITTTITIASLAEAMVMVPDPMSVVHGLCDAAQSPEERLTLAGVLIFSYLRVVRPDSRGRLITRLRALLANCGTSVSRAGATAEVLSPLIDVQELRTDYGSVDPGEAMAWAQGISAVPPTATLADAPTPTVEWPSPLRALLPLDSISLFAMAKASVRAEGEDPAISESDRRLARQALADAKAAPVPAPGDRLRDLFVDLADQAMTFAADGVFSNESLRALVDNCRALRLEVGDSESLRLWSQAVRLRGVITASQLPEPFDADLHAASFLDLSADYAEVIWHLDLERWIYDDDLLISMERSLARIQYASWLEQFDQHATAASYGVPAVSDPLALSTVGPDTVVWLGGAFVALWGVHTDSSVVEEVSPTDPTGWIRNVLPLLDNDTRRLFTDPEEIEVTMGLVTAAAHEVAQRFEMLDLLMEAAAVLERKRGDTLWSSVSAELYSGLTEAAESLESELLPPEDDPVSEWLADIDTLDADDIVRSARLLEQLAEFRKALDPGIGDDATRASLALIDAVLARFACDEVAAQTSLASVWQLSQSADKHVARMVHAVSVLAGEPGRRGQG